MTFRHEDAETVFCPKCQTTLCEIVKEEEKAFLGKKCWKANGYGLFLLMLFLSISLLLGYFWWKLTWDFVTPGMILLVILAFAPKWISHAIERTMPDTVDYDDCVKVTS